MKTKRKLPAPPLLKTLHWLVDKALRASGYHWELRRSGELRLGLWRKTLRKVSARAGDGLATPKRLVFVPGFLDTPLSWTSVFTLMIPVLKSQFDEIILVDFPGYGGFLSADKPFHSMDLMMTALFDTFDSLKPHTLIAHSLGGYLSAFYAAQCGMGERPARNKKHYGGPERLILVAPSGVFENEKSRKQWDRKMQSLLDDRYQAMRPFIFAKEPYWFRWVAPEIEASMARDEIELFLKSIGDRHALEAIIENIRAKLFLIWEEKDGLIPAASLKGWLKTFPQNQAFAAVLKGVGHSPQLESTAVTARILSQVLGHAELALTENRWYRTERGQITHKVHQAKESK